MLLAITSFSPPFSSGEEGLLDCGVGFISSLFCGVSSAGITHAEDRSKAMDTDAKPAVLRLIFWEVIFLFSNFFPVFGVPLS